MRFYFNLGLVLVTSSCGITAECGVDKSLNTSVTHVCAFCETNSSCKNAKCDAYVLFCGTNSHKIGEQKISPESDLFKRIFIDSDYPGPVVPNLFMLWRTCRFQQNVVTHHHRIKRKIYSQSLYRYKYERPKMLFTIMHRISFNFSISNTKQTVR